LIRLACRLNLCLIFKAELPGKSITGNISVSFFVFALTPIPDVDKLPSPDSCECVHEPKAEKALSEKLFSDPALKTTPECIF
jgi:hypothetical protein